MIEKARILQIVGSEGLLRGARRTGVVPVVLDEIRCEDRTGPSVPRASMK
jgi:hypothetical protein